MGMDAPTKLSPNTHQGHLCITHVRFCGLRAMFAYAGDAFHRYLLFSLPGLVSEHLNLIRNAKECYASRNGDV
jgi:hypothetical protein